MRKIIFVLLLCGAMLSPVPQVFSQADKNIVTAAQVNGTWSYKNNTFKVWALGNQRLKVEFLGTYEYKVNGEWMANAGSGGGIAFIEGITARFRPEDADDECNITMTFKGGKLVVDQEGGCGFGHNVIASGTYRKTSSRKPKFND
jgi:hypothetical protein